MATFKISEKSKFVLVIAVAGIVLLLLGYFVLADWGKRSRKDAQELRLAEAQLNKVIRMREQRDVVTAEYTKYQAYLAPERMEPRQLVEELLREIERIARDSGASIINLSPQGIPEASRKQKEYRIDLRVECSADQLLVFLNSVQESKFLIKVARFSASAKDEQGVLLKVEMLVSLTLG